ncbi:polysaccharide pyruvyl transferase family protein [Gracilibacillus lacisalsi]|uniref:polysaccharide pyruvyl transferase family protein n=1 Tax=Gracilibacillus lacisalsi TaxID=393087 RepID=UPI000362293B|nr:polysaccharide pyruvyl transferase family protein [Gracilibacillus lacisalsi]
MNEKIIEINGINFHNKGAELMLHAIIQEFSDREKYKLVTDFTVGPYDKRFELGLYQKFRVNPLGFEPNVKGHKKAMLNMKKDVEEFNDKKFFYESLGLINPEEVEVVLDASGFKYSSQWGDLPTQVSAFLYEKWANNGKKIILLPQAFGPFNSVEIKKSFISILESITLIYARDEISYKHIMSICPDKYAYKVKKAPDFTCLLKWKCTLESEKHRDSVCIIPNFRMIDKTNEMVADWYISLLENCVNHLIQENVPFFCLIHETKKDHILTAELERRLNSDIKMVVEENPLRIKSILANSKAVIGSRYHGLVSALTQNIPTVGIGWSHKYKELFKDFHSEEMLIENFEDKSKYLEKINRLLSVKRGSTLFANIQKGRAKYKEEVVRMWRDVKSVI